MLTPKRYIACDVETSGLSPSRGGRVIEVGAVAFEDGRLADEFGTLINVDCSIHRAAQRVHGGQVGARWGRGQVGTLFSI